MSKVKVICKNCGKVFEIYPSNVDRYIYCSVDCRKADKSVIKICEECGKEFKQYKSSKTERRYCSKECELASKQKKLVTKKCPQCGKIFELRACEANRYTYCSIACRTAAKTIHTVCSQCGKPISVFLSKYKNNSRGVFCSSKCSELSQITGRYEKCANCGKDVYVNASDTYVNHFCSMKCQNDYKRKHRNCVIKTCVQCGKEYETKSSQVGSKYCSKACKNKWQSENRLGENSPRFSSVKMKCDNCGRNLYVPPHKIGAQNKHFCSYKCTHEYYKVIDNRTIKQRARDKTVHLDAIKGLRPKLTAPHVAIIDVLHQLSIEFQVEHNVKYYLLDIHLPEHNLAIEIQGDYWHCNPCRYDSINYVQQLSSIRRDKSKHTYVKKKYGYEILYLWEHDIVSNITMCVELIKLYINNLGQLPSYQSFNFALKDSMVQYCHKHTAYQEMNANQMRPYIKLKNDVS